MTHDKDTGRFQGAKEALWIAYPRHRMHALAGELAQRRQRLRLVQPGNPADRQPHATPARDIAVVEHCVDRFKAPLRFAQRPGRQTETVVQPVYRVDDRQFDVTAHAIVLQAVVADHDIHLGMPAQQVIDRRRPVRADAHRHLAAPRDQQRLVTAVSGIALRVDEQRPFIGLATIAARHHPRSPAHLLQLFDQKDHERRLADPADRDIADHDQRTRETPRAQNSDPIQATAQADQRAEQLRQRPQQPGAWPATAKIARIMHAPARCFHEFA